MAAVATRLYFMTFPGSADLFLLRTFSERMVDVGPRDYYLADYQHYLPGYLYVFWGIGEFIRFFFPNPSNETYFFILRIPPNLIDMATAFLIFKIVSKWASPRWAVAAPALYLFNPAVLYNTGPWGQFDTVPTFLMLLAVYLLLEKKPELSAGLLAYAFLVKAQTLAIIPLYSLALVLKTPPKRIVLSAAVAGAALFFIQLPFFLDDPFLGMYKLTREIEENYPFVSVNGWNLWEIYGGWPKSDTETWLGISLQGWGIVLWLSAQAAAGFWMFKRGVDNWSVYWASALVLFAFFILPTRIHERYLFPFFAFFLVSALLSRWPVPLLGLYGVISVLHFFNLYYVEQEKPYPILEPLFNFVLKQDVAISCALVAAFVALLAGTLAAQFLRVRIRQEQASVPSG